MPVFAPDPQVFGKQGCADLGDWGRWDFKGRWGNQGRGCGLFDGCGGEQKVRRCWILSTSSGAALLPDHSACQLV
jgi:hypothetical protein